MIPDYIYIFLWPTFLGQLNVQNFEWSLEGLPESVGGHSEAIQEVRWT